MFGNNKEDKKAQDYQRFVDDHGLGDINDPQSLKIVERLAQQLARQGYIDIGMKLGNATDSVFYLMQKTIMEQNFLIIRQLDTLTKLLEDHLK